MAVALVILAAILALLDLAQPDSVLRSLGGDERSWRGDTAEERARQFRR